MNQDQPLRGGCSCGRNRFLISIPSNASNTARVLFDDSTEQRGAHSTLLPTSLRIPLSWLHSTTYAFYPDEAHSSIRRVFTPHHAPHTKRHFCGFCGTTLTHWSEESPEDAELVYVSIESLSKRSLGILDEGIWKGALPVEESDSENASSEVTTTRQAREVKGAPWFEEMIEGSALGRMKRRRGGETSEDGRTRVKWEVVEFDGEEDDGSGGAVGAAKSKIGEVGDGDNVQMRAVEGDNVALKDCRIERQAF